MLKFVASRFIQSIVVLLCILTITFFLMRIAPGSPFTDEKAIPEHAVEAMKEAYWLDREWYEQLGRYYAKFVTGFQDVPSLKNSGYTVNEIIFGSLPVSMVIGLGGLLIALVLGIPLGLISAARKNTAVDYSLMSIALVGICLPSFVIGPILATLFAIHLNIGPTAGWWNPLTDWFLPSLTLGLFYTGYFARLTRGGMLETLNQDYIRTARAKGLPEWRILVFHGLKGGLQPALSFMGPAVAGLIGGSFVVETIFALPGLGRVFINAATNRDDPLLMGTVLTYGALILTMNFLVDLAQMALNPRLRGAEQPDLN
ncbi:MAG: oligopeptide transport system permease protein [Verrucomicrobiales bacterium]|jgi:oligopeptide transport system permease protein